MAGFWFDIYYIYGTMERMKYPSLKDSAVYAVIVLVTVLLVFGLFSVAGKIDSLQGEVSTLTSQVETKDKEIGSLRESLSATEEGKKQVEEAKKASDATAAANARRAGNAEADAAAKGAQLASVNSQLATANTQLANVNRCVAKFDSIRPIISRYQQAQVDENDAWNRADSAYQSGNYSTYLYWLGKSNEYTQLANSLWPSISATLNAVASGNCY